MAPDCWSTPSTPQRRLSALSCDQLPPSDSCGSGRTVARATTIATESRFAIAFAPSPLNTPSARPALAPSDISPMTPTSYLGASEPMAVARSASCAISRAWK